MPEQRAEVLDRGCYVYAVVQAPPPGATALTGIDDGPVDFVEMEGIAAAVGEIALDRPPGRGADLMAHGAVVDALAALGPVVPVQFGSVVEDRESVVRELLAPRHDDFTGLLTQLEGTAQFNLRATYREEQVLAEVVAENPEIAELHRRTRDLPPDTVHPDLVRLGESVSHAMDRKREGDQGILLEAVQPFVLATTPRSGGGVEHLLEAALLVENARLPELEASLETLAEVVHERIRLRLVGPMAPYDFVGEETWA